MKKLSIACILVVYIAAFILQGPAFAGGIFKFRGEGASAIFTSVDGSGCVWTDVYLNPNEGVFQSPPGKGTLSSGVYMYITQYDVCTDTQLLAAEGSASLADSDFQVFGNLSSATLDAVVTLYDYVSGTYFDVFVDLTWTGTGSINRQSSNSHFSSPGCKFHSRFNGSFRPAVATGTVSDGVTNYTPEPSWGYDIYSARNGEVFIGCN
ncbi:MAG TPA: hypothetical protein VFY26_09470 [Anaerolineales bacterium]|nr:hypothetical protein [Anaerolineales bacterium]